MSRLPAVLAGAGLIATGYLLLHSQNEWSAGAQPLIGSGAALLGWRLGPKRRGRFTARAVAAPPPTQVSPDLPQAEQHRSSPRPALLSAAFDQSGTAMVITDSLDRIVMANQAFLSLSGLELGHILGQPAELLGMQPLRPSHLPGIDEAIRRGERWSGETSVRGADGQHLDLWLAVSTIRDDERRISHHTRVFQDVEPLKAQLRQMAEQARHDSLTGLSNRRAFGELMFQAMARTRRYTKTLAIMCVDLDGFKSVNDTYGHQVGDQLLITVARRLEACVRTTDRVCRMGGDEFMLILEGPGQSQEIAKIGERVLQSIKDEYCIDEHTIRISSSVGVVVYDGKENDQSLIQRADTAMYTAKHSGKSQVVFITPPDEAPAVMCEPPRLVSQRA